LNVGDKAFGTKKPEKIFTIKMEISDAIIPLITSASK
jgi:hypothetical protein